MKDLEGIVFPDLPDLVDYPTFCEIAAEERPDLTEEEIDALWFAAGHGFTTEPRVFH